MGTKSFTYKGQQMRKWVPLAAIGGILAILVVLVVVAVKTRPVPAHYYAEKPLTSTVSSPSGQTAPVIVNQQPDHGWLYYYLAYSILRQDVQPTYHTPAPYVPRTTYSSPARSYTSPSPTTSSPGWTPSRSSGGFSSTPSKSYSTPSRSTGGFSSSPSRSYSSPSSSRSSGGFSSKPSAPKSSSRSSGGFSKKR